MLRYLLFFLFISPAAWSQSQFPQDWFGKWEGELSLYPSGMKIPMMIEIAQADSVHKFLFKTVYNTGEKEDVRNYTLIEKDKKRGLYVVDEHNSILIAKAFHQNMLVSNFSVQGTQLTILYRFESEQIVFEVFAGSTQAMLTTGGLSEEIPEVKSYLMGNYQKAILKKMP
jgi:hypothetical protein